MIFRQPFFSFFFFFFFFFAVFKEPKKPAIVKKRNVLFITVAFYRFIEIVAVGRISRTRFWKFFPLPSPSSYVPFINYRDYGYIGKGVGFSGTSKSQPIYSYHLLEITFRNNVIRVTELLRARLQFLRPVIVSRMSNR